MKVGILLNRAAKLLTGNLAIKRLPNAKTRRKSLLRFDCARHTRGLVALRSIGLRFDTTRLGNSTETETKRGQDEREGESDREQRSRGQKAH